MLKKNDTYQVEIIDQGFEGEGIAKIENITVFVEGAIKGEIVQILIVKVLTNFAYGKLLSVIKKSDKRNTPDCATFDKCGGCSLRHMSYEATLDLKRSIVENCLYKELHRNIEVKKCIGMKNPIGYRNKLIYPVGLNKDNKPTMGVFAKRTHNIVNVERCYLQNDKNEEIAKKIFNFLCQKQIKPYNEQNGTGLIRHIIVRSGYKTGEVMVIIVIKEKELPFEKELVKLLNENYPEVKTIVKNINSQNTNVILGKQIEVIYGDGYIYDNLGEYKFKISPFSFYQVNPIQTEILYNTAINYAGLAGKENVFDLYCGIGTIGLFASKNAKKVYGIEVVAQAISDAKENASLNNVRNAEFMVGKVEEVLPNLVKKESADVVFIDPPRKGCDKKTLETLLEVNPKKIVYVSCNPSTLARDVSILGEKYTLKEVQPVDMFPYTSHVECVAVLQLKLVIDEKYINA